MSATPASVILDDSPILYYPLNDASPGTVIVSAEEVMRGRNLGELDAYSNIATFDNSIKPTFGTSFGPCLAAQFWGSAPNNPDLVSPHSGSGIGDVAHVDPVFEVNTWTAEAWIRTTVATNLSYNFNATGYNGDPTANCALYPWHTEGGTNTNLPPTGFGMNIGTNGYQLLGHHGSYLTGPTGFTDLSSTAEHHFVITCTDNGNNTQTVRVWIDGVLHNTDSSWAASSSIYPLRPPVNFGIGPYMAFYGSIRHFAVYDYVLPSDRIAAHFQQITCERGHKNLLSGLQVVTRAHFDRGFRGRADDRTASLTPVSGVSTSGVIVPWNATGWKYKQVSRTDPTDYSAASYDDSAWAVGQAPMGSDNVGGNGFDQYGGYNVNWDLDTRIWLRRALGHIASGSVIALSIRVDNYVSAWWNGSLVVNEWADPSGGLGSPHNVTLPSSVLSGSNVLAIRATDDPPGSNDKCVIDLEITGSGVGGPVLPDCGLVGGSNPSWVLASPVTATWRDPLHYDWHTATADTEDVYDLGITDICTFEFTVTAPAAIYARWLCGGSNQDNGSSGVALEVSGTGTTTLSLYHAGVLVSSVNLPRAPVAGDDVKLATDFGGRTAKAYYNGTLEATLDFAAESWYTADASGL